MDGLQINLESIEVNIKALEGKLAHEKSKFQDYSADLKEAQDRYCLSLSSRLLPAFDVVPLRSSCRLPQPSAAGRGVDKCEAVDISDFVMLHRISMCTMCDGSPN